MEIIIYGIKDGFRVLYQTEGAPLSLIYDARVDNPDRACIGRCAYGVSAVKEGFTFTKYVITKNLIYNGSNTYVTIGNIAFMLYLQKEEKMSGENILSLLDNLSNEFSERYIHDGQYGRETSDGRIEDQSEEWDFVAHIMAPFEKSITRLDAQEAIVLMPGTHEPAYFYYTSEEQLKYCFEQRWPYYQHYRQILFIDHRLKDLPCNPLRSLRHDKTQNLTPGMPTQNAQNQSGKTESSPSESQPLEVRAPLKNAGEKKAEVTLSLTVLDETGNAIPEVTLVRNGVTEQTEITFHSGMISFEGTEMDDLWFVLSKNGTLISDTFQPSDYADQVLPSVVLHLHQRKIITFKVVDAKKTNIELKNHTIKLTCNGTNEIVENDRHIFEADGIKKHYQLQISCEGYTEQFLLFSPETSENLFLIKMDREIKSESTQNRNPENPFSGGNYVKKKSKNGLKILVVFLIIAVLGGIIGLSIYFFGNKNSRVPPYISSEKVQGYLDDNLLNIDTLSLYLDSCKDAENILLTEATPETKQWASKYADLQEQLNRAIQWRNAINNGDIALAQNNYFPEDSSLFLALRSISRYNIDHVNSALKDAAAQTPDMAVPEIGTFIKNVIRFLDIKRKYERLANDSTTADTTYQRILKQITDLNLPDLALVANIRTPLCRRLGIETKNTTPALPAATVTATVPKKQNHSEIEQFKIDFWELVRSGDNNFEHYKELRNSAFKLSSVSIDNCPELNYLHNMTENMTNPTWEHFKTLTPALKKKAQNVEELK